MRFDVKYTDITNAPERLIVHQVNCMGVMGSGVAKSIREKWPEVYTEYKKLCDTYIPESLLGVTQILNLASLGVKDENDKYVCNLFSQCRYGYDGKRYTNYLAFARGLEKIIEFANEPHVNAKTIAIPAEIGCGRGGGDIKFIHSLLAEAEKRGDIKFILYKIGERG